MEKLLTREELKIIYPKIKVKNKIINHFDVTVYSIFKIFQPKNMLQIVVN